MNILLNCHSKTLFANYFLKIITLSTYILVYISTWLIEWIPVHNECIYTNWSNTLLILPSIWIPLCRLSLLSTVKRRTNMNLNNINNVEFTVSYSNMTILSCIHYLCVCRSSIVWLQKSFWQIPITTQQNWILSSLFKYI